MHTLNKNSKTGYSADQFYRHEAEVEEEKVLYGGFGREKAPVDLNGACVWEKQGNGDQPIQLSEIQLNIRERFGMEAPLDFTKDGSPLSGNTIKGEPYDRGGYEGAAHEKAEGEY